MAISTGDICQDSITKLQNNLGVQPNQVQEVCLDNLCFIFKKKYELDGADARTDLQDMFDWLRQSITFTPFKLRPYIDW
ncbi:MAG: hypothetical protein ACW99G_23145 [Candidatus Thorarchaeota archaeon]|jgi:hypothetical protein